jgi:hypothetical protein
MLRLKYAHAIVVNNRGALSLQDNDSISPTKISGHSADSNYAIERCYIETFYSLSKEQAKQLVDLRNKQ